MFLTDEELVYRLKQANPPVTGLPPATLEVPYQKDSKIQAASLDLTIGSILIPGKSAEQPGGVKSPITDDHVLKSGETVVVVTKECLRLPTDLGAFGFPPSSLSSKGLLMTNPGHVDPGFVGNLRFTVINMAQDDLALSSSTTIVTLLFYRLSVPSKKGWTERTGLTAAAFPTERQVNRLSSDFLNITKRAERAAATEEAKTRRMSIIAPIAIGILAFAASIAGTFVATNDKISTLEKDTAVLKADQERQQLDKRLATVEGKLKSTSKKKGEE
jgi:deoxycytidine triphosphate deaminase